MTGPVTFSDDTAREQLVTRGEVITFRASERTTGWTWWRESRTGEKQGECYIEKVKNADPSYTNQLLPYRSQSGFDTVEEWQAAIEELNGDLETGYLYRVETPTSPKIKEMDTYGDTAEPDETPDADTSTSTDTNENTDTDTDEDTTTTTSTNGTT
jgi:hypothetical protein